MIDHHSQSKMHKDAVDQDVMQQSVERHGGIQQAFQRQINLQQQALIGALKVTYCLAKEELPLTTKYEPLLDLALSSDMIQQYNQIAHPVDENLPAEVHIYQVKVVSAFLKAGIPLSKLDCFHELLQENALSLSGSQHLRELIPMILHDEHNKLKQHLSGRQVSVIFDGTTHVAEAMAVVARYIDNQWQIHQCIACLMLLAKSLTGEVARQLITTLSTELGIPSQLLVACMRDRASVNNVAMRTVSIVYPLVFDIGCFSHTLDLWDST